MVSFLLRRFCSSWSKTILFVIVILGISGLGLSFFAHYERKLVFHQDWTETDRRQMKEIQEFVNAGRKVHAELKEKDFKENIQPLSFRRLNDWPRLCETVYKYYREKLGMNEFYYLADTVIQTARTGNARYVGKNGYTVLQYACALGKRDLAVHLMDKGADVNVRNRQERVGIMVPGDAPVHLLALGGLDFSHALDQETVLFLIDKLVCHGADVNMKSAGGLFAPFELACFSGRRFKRGTDVEAIVLKLIDLGTNVNIPFEHAGKKVSPLMFPVKYGYGKAVRRLCEMGVDVNERYDDVPPLFYINLRSNPKEQATIARTLMDYGARIDEQIQYKPDQDMEAVVQTPLSRLCTLIDHFLYEEEEKKCFLDLFALYSAKADVNLVSEGRMTPLMCLFEKMYLEKNPELRIEAARCLLQSGADPSLKNDQGKTVGDIIRSYQKFEKEVFEKLPELRPVK